MRRGGQLKRRDRPFIVINGSWKRSHGLCPDEIEAFYARIDAIRSRVMRETPWRRVAGWDGRDEP